MTIRGPVIDPGRPRPKIRGQAEPFTSRPIGRFFFATAGLALAVPALVVCLGALIRLQGTEEIDRHATAIRLLVAVGIYSAGVFLICLAWKQFDIKRASAKTLLVVFFSLVAVVLAAKVIAVLAGLLGVELGGSGSRDSDSGSSGSDSGSKHERSSFGDAWMFTDTWSGGGSGGPESSPAGRREPQRHQDLCPGCGMPAGSGPTGLCPRCTAGLPF